MKSKSLIGVEGVGFLMERLTIEILKVRDFEHFKVDEHKKSNPDLKKIAEWDKSSRAANENKAKLVSAIDEKLEALAKTGKYEYLKNVRTFSLTKGDK